MGKNHASQYANFGSLLNTRRERLLYYTCAALKIGDFLRQGNILNALNYICSFLFSNEFSSVFKNWYKVKKRVLIKVELIYFFK